MFAEERLKTMPDENLVVVVFDFPLAYRCEGITALILAEMHWMG